MNQATTAPILLALASCLAVPPAAPADDWPTHLHDYARSGRTAESIATPLGQQWTFVSANPPETAWQGPIPGVVEGNEEMNRVDYDNAFQVTVAGNNVYFGSSSDDQVYCLDLSTGKIRWRFFTEGPVRLAPTFAVGRIYFGSDDGRLYCLDADSGAALWRVRLGPDNSRHLGNGRMISRWPVRTDVIVDQGIAWCGAGVFPHEGVMLAAFDAVTGETLWKNDGIGQQNANRSRFSPQGYLLASDDILYSPSGRDLPAAFDRKTGVMKFHSSTSWRASGIVGGTYATLVDGHLLTGANQNVALDAETGRTGFGWFTGRRTVSYGELSCMVTDRTVELIDRDKYAAGTRRLRQMQARHDGRQKDDVKYLWSEARSRLKSEQGRDRQKQDPDKIAALKKQVAEYQARLKAMAGEEAAYEKQFITEATRWKVSLAANGSLIGTPETVFAGGNGFVAALDLKSGRELWRGQVTGKAAGLAVANGNLLVSSDTGTIHCFRPGVPANPSVIRPDAPDSTPFPDDDKSRIITAAAESILAKTEIRRGFALVLGLETGQLACELAKRTELKVIAIEADAAKVAAARTALARAGLHGNRVSVIQADPDRLPISNLFANLVLSESELFDGRMPGRPADIARTVRPLGGQVLLRNGAEKAGRKFLEALDLGPVKQWQGGESWASVERGPLPGAGSWTHQYANEGNTSSSRETRLKAPLGVLWYGDPGPTEMINRHSQGSPPVSLDGRMFIVGRGVVLAYDAYNGTKLWEQSYEGGPRLRTRSIPGAIVASTNGVFLATKDQCIHFDPATGSKVHVFDLPESIRQGQSRWSYLGIHNNTLVGSLTDSFTGRYSRALFAYDVDSRKLLWTYSGKNIAQLCIALGDGKAFLIDSSMTDTEREIALLKDRSHLAKLTGEARKKAEARLKAADLHMAMALDLETGKKLWSNPLDLTGSTGIHRSHGELMMMYHNGMLIFAGASGNGHYWDQYIAGEFKQRKLSVVSAQSGEEIWAKEADYRIRPLVVGETIIAEPWAYDLYNGAPKMREHPTTGEQTPWRFIRSGHHCGHIAATENLMFFRSLSTAYYDLQDDNGVSHFAGMRTGCTINMIPANGLVHIPEASAGCQCLFAIQSTVTLEHVPEDRDRGWGIFNSPGSTLPVKHLCLNLGAPGDRRDNQGRLWLAWPRPNSSSRTRPLEFTLEIEIEGMHMNVHDRLADAGRIRGADIPWIFTSGYEGASRFSIPVIGRNDQPGLYTVRLYFTEPNQLAQAGERLDISLQDRKFAADFAAVRDTASSHHAVVKEFTHVEIFDHLEMSIASPNGAAAATVISAIEILHTGELDKPKPPSYHYPPPWPDARPTVTLQAVADSFTRLKSPTRNEGSDASLLVDGGGSRMGDDAHALAVLKFDLSGLPGRPLAAKLRLQCLGPGSRDAGSIYLVEDDWEESKITFDQQPATTRRIGKIDSVAEKERIERPLAIPLEGRKTLSILLRPSSTDGIRYSSREGDSPPELVVAYEPK